MKTLASILAMQAMFANPINFYSNGGNGRRQSTKKTIMSPKEYAKRKSRLRMIKKNRSINHSK